VNGQRKSHQFTAAARQRGQAILFTLLLVGVGFAMFVYGAVRSVSLDQEQDVKTRLALVQVRDALIGWSAARTSPIDGANARPGELPCPDINPLDGYEDGNCAAGAIGRVPWKTLGIPEPKDETGETLWYAIGGPFRIWGVNANPINSDTKGNITVYLNSTATQLTGEAVAVVFAPGAPLGTQNRSSTVTALCPTTGTTIARNLCAANYLDSTGGANNATTNGPFISAQRSASFNDRLLVLTTAELMPPVEIRVARALQTILQNYKTAVGVYPWADCSDGVSDVTPSPSAVVDGGNRGRIPWQTALPVNWGSGVPVAPTLPTWFVNNNWSWVIYYSAGKNFLEGGGARCSTCVDTTLTVDGVAGKEVVLLTTGPAGASRPMGTPGDCQPTVYWPYYLEDPQNNDASNDIYVTPSATAYARDRIFAIP
jgi:hypothetical protein